MKTIKFIGRAILTSAMAWWAVDARAATVTPDDARYAARGWSMRNASAFGGVGNVAEVTAENDPDDGSVLWYTVKLQQGVAIVSPDTEIEPVIAMLPDSDGTIPEDSPLRAILTRDLRQRKRLLSVSGTTLKSAAGSKSSPASKWSKLISHGKGLKLLNSSGNPATIVKWLDGWNRRSTETGGQTLRFWDQDYAPSYFKNTKIFNYNTPNNSPCGCVATAGSAVLHYYRIASGNSVGRWCSYNGSDRYLTTTGGPYDWSLIDGLTLTYGSPITLSTEVCRDLLGRVASDVGIGCYMSYTSSQSGSSSYGLTLSFRTVFNFQNAQLVTTDGDYSGPNDGTTIDSDYYPEIIYNQIRAGAPVVLGIDSHEVVAAGFGIDSDGQDYTFVFLGWGSSNDGWYALPTITTKATVTGGYYTSEFIDELVTEIAPSDNKFIPLVGRVTNESGEGLAGESLLLSDGSRVTTDANGYWATRVEPASGYVIAESQSIKRTYTIGTAAKSTSTEPLKASTLAAALPDEINFVLEEQQSEPSAQPTSLSATAATDGSKVTLAWNYSSANATYYIYRAETNVKPSSHTYVKTSSVSGAITYDDANVVSGTTYYYWVSAKQSGDNYTESEAVGPVTATPKKTLQSIAIGATNQWGSAVTSVSAGNQAHYYCKAYYSDGSYAYVNPWFSIEPEACGVFSGSTLTASPMLATTNATVLAVYNEGDVLDGKTATCKLKVYASTALTHPGNDNFANATAITGTSGNTSGTTVGATTEANEYSIAKGGEGIAANTVWWSWTASESGKLTLSTQGSGIATALDVFSGTALSGSAVASDYSTSASGYAYMQFTVTKGTRYNIRIAGYNNAEGSVALSWSWVALDKIAAPTNLSVSYNGVSKQVELSWNKGASYCHYKVYRAASKTQPAMPSSAYHTTSMGVLAYNDTSLTPGATYWYWVTAAKDGYSDSDPVGPLSATIPTQEEAAFQYVLLTGGGAYITNYVGSATAIVVPDTLVGNPVIGISPLTFFNDQKIVSIKFPETIKSVDDMSFCFCSNLVSVTFPTALTNIGEYAFYHCSKLSSADIPVGVREIRYAAFCGCDSLSTLNMCQGITNIAAYAFQHCSSLNSVTIPKGTVTIGVQAFCYCSSLSSVVIPSSVTSIGTYAFYGCNLGTVYVESEQEAIRIRALLTSSKHDCSGITFVTSGKPRTDFPYRVEGGQAVITNYIGSATAVDIPSTIDSYTVVAIGESAFGNLSAIESVKIPSTVTNIGDSAFAWSYNLSSIDIPSSVTVIGDNAFLACSSLTTVTLPPNLKRLGIYVFGGCFSLESVEIPSGVTSIGDFAFSDCYGLQSIEIPELVSQVGIGAFRACTNLTEIAVDSANAHYAGSGGVLYSKDLSVLVAFPCGWTGAFTVPSTVVEIGGTAFSGCPGLTAVVLQSGMSCIGNSAFCACTGLTSVTIPSSVTVIDDYAFYSCDRLSTIYVDADDTDRVRGLLEDSGLDCANIEFVEPETPEPTTQVATPVITPPDGTEFSDTCTIALSCATAGASIYYTTNGVTPKLKPAYLYSGMPFTVNRSVVIKAVAVKTGMITSECATATISKIVSTAALEIALDVTDDVTVDTDAGYAWTAVADATAKVGGFSARSGLAHTDDNRESSLQVSVSGRGTVSFWVKTSCEHDYAGSCTWDRLMVYSDGVELSDLRMDGVTDWIQRSVKFTTVGEHVVKWVYHKDDADYEGEDCAWVDGVVWTADADDPIPDLGDDATSDQIAEVLDGAADERLSECITDASNYQAFRDWAGTVKTSDGSATAGAEAVMNAPNAWLSYALDSAKLIAAVPESEDLKIESFEPSATAGQYEFTVSIDQITVGDDAQAANLAKVFGLEGGATPESSGLSSEDVNLAFDAPENGKVKFTAGPKDSAAQTFFMRVRMTP